jgi:hypothetical protein
VKNWQGEVVGSVEVPVWTLDQAIAKFGVPHYCKIDVEGYELEVLKGLSQVIPTLSYEYHLRNDGVIQALTCLDYLSQFGELLINITPAEQPFFAGTQWWVKNDFIGFFRQIVPQLRGYDDYGDIFVKIRPAEKKLIETVPQG